MRSHLKCDCGSCIFTNTDALGPVGLILESGGERLFATRQVNRQWREPERNGAMQNFCASWDTGDGDFAVREGIFKRT